jgi:hypothetical protein
MRVLIAFALAPILRKYLSIAQCGLKFLNGLPSFKDAGCSDPPQFRTQV